MDEKLKFVSPNEERFWTSVMVAALPVTKSVPESVSTADNVLVAYRLRAGTHKEKTI